MNPADPAGRESFISGSGEIPVLMVSGPDEGWCGDQQGDPHTTRLSLLLINRSRGVTGEMHFPTSRLV